MRKRLLLVTVISIILACQVIPTPPALKTTPRPSPTVTRSIPLLTAVPATSNPSPSPADPNTAPGQLAPFPVHLGIGFAPLQLIEWSPTGAEAPPSPELPSTADRIANPGVLAGLSFRQRAALLQDGFVIVRSREPQFAAIRTRVSDRYGQPYYLTTDAAFHAVDLAVDDLRVALEREELHRRMIIVAQAGLDETLAYLPFVQGADLEPDVLQAALYLGTGLRLLDPQVDLPDVITERVDRQVAQVKAGRGVEDAILVPGYRDDFTIYRPVPPYAGDPNLEAYYRGRTWFGRAAFSLVGPDAGRAPLILTMALRQAHISPGLISTPQGAPALAVDEWVRLSEALTFLEGPGAGYGPSQTAVLMDQVYGTGLTLIGLSDSGKLEQFRELVDALPPAQLGGAPQNPFLSAQTSTGWRWMPFGVRLDDSIIAYLAPYRPQSSGDVQFLPTALEFMAVLGSQPALDSLQAGFAQPVIQYSDALARARSALAGQGPAGWRASIETHAFFALSPQTAAKEAGYPPVLHTAAWQTRELASALGAWVNLRRPADQSASTSIPAAQPISAPPPAYVEPNPPVFYRLAYLAASLAEGLNQRGLNGVYSSTPASSGLRRQIQDLLDLAERLQRLGDIAARELQGEALTESDWQIIVAPLGAAEERTTGGAGLPAIPDLVALPEARGAGVNAAGAYAAVGLLDRLYVLVSLEDEIIVAQGGVYSFYEFPQALYSALNRTEWARLLHREIIDPPAWNAGLLLSEGAPVDVLAFHPGDVFRVSSTAGRLNVRAAPGRVSASVRQLAPGDTFTLLDGTAQIQGLAWRQVRLEDGVEGWLVENPAWYERI